MVAPEHSSSILRNFGKRPHVPGADREAAQDAPDGERPSLQMQSLFSSYV